MSRQDIFGHRYYQDHDEPDRIRACEIEETKTVSIVPHNGAYLAECIDSEGDVTFYLEEFQRNDLVNFVRAVFADRADVKIDEGG